MADNTIQGATDTLATDDVTTLNGAGSSGVKVERIKVGYGDDGTYRDASAAFPLPVNISASAGNLSAVTGSLTASAANTPGSAVTASTSAQVVAASSTAGNVTFHLVTSAFVGTVTFEGSVDAGLNYSPLYCLREDGTGAETGTVLSTAAAFIRQYTTALPGFAYFRVRCSAFTSGTLAVVIQPGPILIESSPAITAQSRTSTYSAAAASTLTTELNSLAAAAYCAPSAAIDNSSALDLYDDLELTVTFAVAPVVNTLVEVYIIPSVDGTNYADASSSIAPSPNLYVGGFPVRAVTTAQRMIVRGIPLPPGLFKYQVRNGTAQAFPASGSVMKRRPYRLQLG